jgi:hypothetical protein
MPMNQMLSIISGIASGMFHLTEEVFVELTQI